MLLWTLAAFILLFIIAVIIVLIVSLSRSHMAAAPGQKTGVAPSSAVRGPSARVGFLGIPLTGKQIIFSLDGSSANLNSFNLLAADVKQTVAKLGAGHEIKFALWTPHGLTLLPRKGWITPPHATGAEHTLLNYSPYGSTSAAKAMRETLKLGGDQIIFVTAKVFLSQSDLPAQIAKLRAPDQHIDVISVNGERKELQQLAKQSAGQFRFVTISDLQNAMAQ